MKIQVLNGSPKGATSVTMQYVRYLQQRQPQHELKIVHISQEIRQLEKDPQAFQIVLADLADTFQNSIEKTDNLYPFPRICWTICLEGQKPQMQRINRQEKGSVLP